MNQKQFENKVLYAMEQVEDGEPLKDYLDGDEIIAVLDLYCSMVREGRRARDEINKVTTSSSGSGNLWGD